jgi:DNA-binding MarR family transcriptional regulator
VDNEFLELISLADRVHRSCLQLVKTELDLLAVHDINSTQALILLKIGYLSMTQTDLLARGWYHGTNPSYNLNRLVDCGLVAREPRARDRRSSSLRLTDRGHHLRRLLLALYRRQTELASDEALSGADVAAAADALRQIERSLAAVAKAGQGLQQPPSVPAPRAHRKARTKEMAHSRG